MSEYVSPIIMERVQRPIEGDPAKDLYEMVEVRLSPRPGEEFGDLLATCMMSDDSGLERIADTLSAKKLWREANRFRVMISSSRKR